MLKPTSSDVSGSQSARPRSGGEVPRPSADLTADHAWSIIDSAPDGIIMVDRSGVILLVNRQTEELFAYDRGELLGRRVEDLLPTRYRLTHADLRERYHLAPRPRAMGAGLDLWARRSDGSEFPVEISLSPMPDIGAGPTGAVVASIRDVSDRAALEAHTQLIQASIDAIHDGVFIFNADTLRFDYVNQGAVTQSGYARAELLELAPYEIAPEFDEERVRELIRPLIDDEVPRVELESVIRSKSGVDLPVEVNIQCPPAIHGATNRVVIAVARNITDRLEAHRLLRESEAAFRSAFDGAPVGMVAGRLTADGQRYIERVNPTFVEMVGWPAEELIGVDIADLTHPDDNAADVDAAAALVRGERPTHVSEKRYLKADGSYAWAQLHTAVIGEGDEPAVLAHIVDVSDRIEAEAVSRRHQALTSALGQVRLAALQGATRAEGLALICRLACATLDATTTFIVTPAPPVVGQDEHLRIEAEHELGEVARSTLRFSVSAGRIGEVYRTGEPVFADYSDLAVGALGADVVSGRPNTPIVLAPLHSGAAIVGVMVVVGAEGSDPLTGNDLQAIEQFASEAVVGIEIAAAKESQHRLELLEDRERIARDLHDLVIQRIFGAGIGLQSLVGTVSPDVATRVLDTVAELDAAISELRSTIFGLSSLQAPGSISDQIRVTVQAQAAGLGFEPHLALPEHVEAIPLVVVEQLLPMLTEALSNVSRHAKATSAEVKIAVGADELVVQVLDDGVGPGEAVGGQGLPNMAARARRLGGDCTIAGRSGGGTVLTWHCDL